MHDGVAIIGNTMVITLFTNLGHTIASKKHYQSGSSLIFRQEIGADVSSVYCNVFVPVLSHLSMQNSKEVKELMEEASLSLK